MPKNVQICLGSLYIHQLPFTNQTHNWAQSLNGILKHDTYCGSLLHVSLKLNSPYFWTPNHSGRIQEDVKGCFLHGRESLPHFLLTLVRWRSKANQTETHQKVTDPNAVLKSTFPLSPHTSWSPPLCWLNNDCPVSHRSEPFSVESLHWLTDLHTVQWDALCGIGIESSWLIPIQHDDLAQAKLIASR